MSEQVIKAVYLTSNFTCNIHALVFKYANPGNC